MIEHKRLRAAEAAAAQATVTSFGPTLLSRTTNNGVTWSKPAIIYDPGPNNQTINNIVQVTPDGSAYTFFTSIIGAAPTIAIGFVKSTDKGVTWSGRNEATSALSRQQPSSAATQYVAKGRLLTSSIRNLWRSCPRRALSCPHQRLPGQLRLFGGVRCYRQSLFSKPQPRAHDCVSARS